MSGKLLIKQVRSGIGRQRKQRLILKALGLGKMNRVVEKEDTAEVRGMIFKITHLLKVTETD